MSLPPAPSSSEEVNAIAAYLREIAQHARTLPLADATAFLHGALILAGDHPAIEPLRDAYARLVVSDAQLELLTR